LSQTAASQPVTPQPPTNINVITPAEPVKKQNPFDFRHLKWYEWLAILPAFVLLVTGGAIGGGIGALGWMWTLKVIRSQNRSKAAKIFMVIGITIGYYILALILASLFRELLNVVFKK